MIGADLHGTEIDTDLGSEVSGRSMTDAVISLPCVGVSGRVLRNCESNVFEDERSTNDALRREF